MGLKFSELPERVKAMVAAAEAEQRAVARPTPPVAPVEPAPALPGLAGLATPTPAPVESNPGEHRLEVRDLHQPFRQWLSLHQIPHAYSRPDKASGLRVGFPDFFLGWNARSAAIEFKVPGRKLRPEQEEVRAEFQRAGVPYLVAFDVAAAIAFARASLGFDPNSPTPPASEVNAIPGDTEPDAA